jgi:hypothetical protein
MPKRILVDELHITIAAPRRLSPAAYRSMRRALRRPGFAAGLDRHVRDFLRRYPSLRGAHVTVSR